jgi:hypothetical protein
MNRDDGKRARNMNAAMIAITCALLLAAAASTKAQQPSGKTASADDSEAGPPVTKADVRIVERAKEILDSPSKWNRADTRLCPAEAKTFNLYCALEKATRDVTGQFEHRGATMQEARFVIEEVAPDWHKYHHRLMDYNNDPATTFADIQKVLRLLQERINKRLAAESATPQK